MYNIVAITDTHIGKAWKTPRIEGVLNAFAEEMEEVRPNVIAHMGDVFHNKRPSASAVEFATQWLLRLANTCDTLVLLPGGHDQDIPNNMTAIDFADDLAPNIAIIYEPTDIDGLFMMPYQRRLTDEHLDMIARSEVCLLHQGVCEIPLDHGQRIYGNVADAVPIDTFKNVKLAGIGHMHTTWAHRNIVVLGAPYQTQYNHPIIERCYLMFDLEKPADYVLVELPTTFYLQKIALNIAEGTEQSKLMKMLPQCDPNTYVDITIGVEGAINRSIVEGYRLACDRIYGDWIDSVTVISVLSSAERVMQRDILRAVTIADKDRKTPADWLDIWMAKQSNAYYESHPELKLCMHEELHSIIDSCIGFENAE